MNDLTKLQLQQQLGTYLFENVWNAPNSEYRQNFIPRVISSIPCSGAINLKAVSILLPTYQSFYVYAIAKCCLAGMIVESKEWVKVSDYINSKPFDLRFHGINGEYLHRDNIYLIDHPYEDLCLVAVERNMARRILGVAYNYKKIFFAPYYDSDTDQTMDSSYYRPTTVLEASTVYTAAINADLVFVNGRETSLRSPEDIQVGDYVETINDPDIIADFTVDLTQPNASRLYRSETNAYYKYIIHIPKALNPNNYLITHNTCDFFVRPKNVPNAHLKGLFLHRCYPVTEGISQITHNDYGIPDPILSGYKGALSTTEIEIRCIARTHKKTRSLIPEANYIDWLYKLEDNTILDFLEDPPENLAFWSAAHLEQSKFIKMLFSTPEFQELAAMEDYIETLGYFNTLALLCSRVQRYTINESMTRDFEIPIPISLRGINMKGHLFIDGLKVHDDKYTNAQSTTRLAYHLDPSVPFEVGSKLIMELFERPPFKAEYFTPIESAAQLGVTGEFQLYRTREIEYDPYEGDYFSKQESFNYSYEAIPESAWESYITTSVIDGVTLITFLPQTYGYQYYVVSKRYFQKLHDQTFIIEDLERTTITLGPLELTATTFTNNTPVVVPIPPTASILCYLNGKELVPGTDISITRKKSSSSNHVYTWLHIQNVSYLTAGTNQLEIYATGEVTYGSASGYLHDSKLLEFKPLIYWRPSLAMLTVDGHCAKDLYFEDGYLAVDDPRVRPGALTHVRAMCPLTVKEFVDTYTEDYDVVRMTAILTYFRQFATTLPPIEVLPYSHRVYSVLLNQVLHDALLGQIHLTYDPEIPRMLNQIPEYLDLRNSDVAFLYTCSCGATVTTTSPTTCPVCGTVARRNLDLRYVDILPSYRLNDSYDPELYVAMLQLTRALLPDDNITDGGSVDV